jgi:aminoglycoside phosphotransferase (APT) family kinase protein
MTTLDQLPPAHTGVVHGDCKPSQFLITERGVVLLDLDHVGISDQAADVGTFLASLRQQDVRPLAGRSGRPSASSASLAELFLAGYLAGGGTCREPSRTRWQEAVALERKALRAFARAPRSPVPRALIVEAHACLDRAEEAS